MQPFGRNAYGPKIGGLCPCGEGELDPHLTQCGQGRGLYLHAKFHLDPSNRLATVHERYRQTGRQTGQTGQRTDSIGRTVLQTVAQKPRYISNSITDRRKIWHNMFAKFGTLTDSVLSTSSLSNCNRKLIRDVNSHHLENFNDIIITQPIVRFARNLVFWCKMRCRWRLACWNH